MIDFFKKTGIVFFIKVVGLIIAFLFQFLLTNNLSPKLYGEYTLFLTYVNMLTIFSLIGLDNSLIKELPIVKRACGEAILLYFFKIMILSVIIINLIFYMFFKEKYSAVFLILVISGIILKSLITLLDSYFQGKGKIVEVNLYSVLFNNILKILFFLILRKYEIYGVFASYFLSEIFCLFLRGIKLNLKSKNKLKLSQKDKYKLLKYGITFTLITSVGILNQNSDKLILEHYLGLEAVGIYKVNQNYLSLLGIFVSPFLAFWPIISKLYNQNKIQEIEETFSNIVKLILVLVIPCFVLIYFKSDKLLELFGKEYSKYGSILILLSIGILIDTSAGPIGAVLTMTKYQKISLYNSIFCLLLNVILSIVLIKKYGVLGVAFSTTLTTILNNLISIIFNKLLLKIMPYKLETLLIGVFNLILLFMFQNFYQKEILIENIALDLLVNLFLLGIISIIINFILYFKILKKIYLGRRNGEVFCKS